MNFGDYIVYVDESGDHSLVTINPEYPMFVLVFCIFDKKIYYNQIVPKIQELKFNFWGHDSIILHSHEIRKAKNDFSILQNAAVRESFISSLNTLINNTNVTIIAAAINKNLLINRYSKPDNPYEIALRFCIERLWRWLEEKEQNNLLTHLIVEKRGHNEDIQLELEFRRIAGLSAFSNKPKLDIKFMDKKHNSTGLQIADLAAYPIARHISKPEQTNRAYKIIESKLRRSSSGKIEGYGLKIFP